ncbi:uncharacterized protein N7529_007145 [Penicillium soppii]|uniref:uncharacterized protein n=1 Tax=Penicillium soppii TaxID=69789 RepID=UPI0025493458|nr:uncharacterized protein N7529_007145 [Penicillium soppii]KAJ5865229.1 hypothetical protein N7529_007145 [Penicillium soppii]
MPLWKNFHDAEQPADPCCRLTPFNLNVQGKGNLLTTKQALCHCDDCRKISGSLFSYNFLVKEADLEITGSPKEVLQTADSGFGKKNYFCGDCGMHLFGGSDTMRAQKGLVVVRVGIFDDVDLEKCRPTAELYPQRRPKWLCALENAEQLESMPPA